MCFLEVFVRLAGRAPFACVLLEKNSDHPRLSTCIMGAGHRANLFACSKVINFATAGCVIKVQ